MSTLRIIAILCGFISLGICFYRLRSHAAKRTDVWMLFIFGLTLMLVGIFPDIVNFPADLLSLKGHQRGRVITLLLVSNALIWFFHIYGRSKAEVTFLQFDKLVRQLTIRNFLDQNETQSFDQSIFVLIPAFNEAENLAAVLPRIPANLLKIPVRILVINDGSTDDTEKVALEHGGLVATHLTNRGGGAALKTGYEIIKILSPLAIVTMDADGQHLPEEIESIVDPIIQGQADVVLGSRILGSCADYSRFRLAGVHFFSKLINIMMGTKITDCSSGFRAIDKSVLQKVILVQDQYHTAEIIIEAAKRGFRILEKPITIECRLSGQSKKGNNFKYGLMFLRTILKSWWR